MKTRSGKVFNKSNSVLEESDSKPKHVEQKNPQRKFSLLWTLAIVVIGVAVILNFYLFIPSSPMKQATKTQSGSCLKDNNMILYTADELAKFTDKPQILLAFLGVVYDVTSGHYYHPDSSYSFFTGKDATRAFLTGNFTVEELNDEITDLDESYFNSFQTWLDLYEEKYVKKGYLVGAYYDENGCPTEKLKWVHKILTKIAKEEEAQKEELNEYPPCNSEWNESTNSGRVWCTVLSGGISRSWTGKPRLMFDLGTKKWRCACVRSDDDVTEWCGIENKPSPNEPGVAYSSAIEPKTPNNCRFKHYSNCDRNQLECPIED